MREDGCASAPVNNAAAAAAAAAEGASACVLLAQEGQVGVNPVCVL